MTDWSGEVRGLVLAHHWTLAEVAALTVEQFVWLRQWQVEIAPARVGRDEARAIVAARTEARAAWVAKVLGDQPTASEVSRPRATQSKTRLEGLRSRLEQASVAPARQQAMTDRRLLVDESHQAFAHPPESGCRTAPMRQAIAPSVVLEIPQPARDIGALSDLIEQVAGQLERLERRFQRGAPLGP